MELYNWYIYKIVNPEGKIYIGKTKAFQNRIRQYKHKCHKNHSYLYISMSLYGFDAHQFEVIDTFLSDDKWADDKEMFWIRTYMSNMNRWPEMNGLNQTDGGKGTLGSPTSATQKLVASQIHKGNKYSLGKIVTESVRQKISKATKGRKYTDEQKKKYIDAIKKKSKAIVQYDLLGNMISEYASISDAFRKTGISKISIVKILKGYKSKRIRTSFVYKNT